MMFPRTTARGTMNGYYELFANSDDDSVKYISSANGILDCVELCLGLGVFIGMFMRADKTCSQKFLFATGLSYGLNGLNIVITSLVSQDTAAYLPTVFYYLMYQFTAMISFTCGGILSLTTGLPEARPTFQAIYRLPSIVALAFCAYATKFFDHREILGLLCGIIHIGHFAYLLAE